MKILHVLFSGDIGGIERLCLDIARNDKNSTFLFLYKGGNLCDEIKKHKSDAIDYCINKHNYLLATIKLISYCNKKKIDNIILHHSGLSLWLPGIVFKLLNPKKSLYIYAHNEYHVITRNKVINRIVFNIISRLATNIFVISNFVKFSIIKNQKGLEAKIVKIYNGIDIERFSFNKNTIFNNPLRIVYVGRLIPEKGVNLLIDAVAKIDIPFILDIVGNGTQKERLQEQINKLRMNGIVNLLGERNDVPKILNSYDVFVHPAIWNEGFGIAIIEAMASGLITIAFNKGSISELIDNNRNGFYVENVSTDLLAKKILFVYNKLRQNNLIDVRLAARNKALDFSINNTIDCLHKIIDK